MGVALEVTQVPGPAPVATKKSTRFLSEQKPRVPVALTAAGSASLEYVAAPVVTVKIYPLLAVAAEVALASWLSIKQAFVEVGTPHVTAPGPREDNSPKVPG